MAAASRAQAPSRPASHWLRWPPERHSLFEILVIPRPADPNHCRQEHREYGHLPNPLSPAYRPPCSSGPPCRHSPGPGEQHYPGPKAEGSQRLDDRGQKTVLASVPTGRAIPVGATVWRRDRTQTVQDSANVGQRSPATLPLRRRHFGTAMIGVRCTGPPGRPADAAAHPLWGLIWFPFLRLAIPGHGVLFPGRAGQGDGVAWKRNCGLLCPGCLAMIMDWPAPSGNRRSGQDPLPDVLESH
jgi:hypothetical protein